MKRILVCLFVAVLLTWSVVGLKNLVKASGSTPVVLATGGSPAPPIPF